MVPVTAEELRFWAYLVASAFHVVHEPNAQTAWQIIRINPRGAITMTYELHIPAVWGDAERIRTTAWYIVQHVLDQLVATPHERLASTPALYALEDALSWQIADELIVPRPVLDEHITQHGRSNSSLRALARLLNVPIQSVHTVLEAKPNPVADQVHQYIHKVTGYPWFLPPDLLDRYPRDRW